ncbi:MAG TPA: gamma-glutamylcyclotransferase family protein [Kofleriaceae bacterium]|nr:gamma-glutamylcyclotransferase family protein [Kofleriaceae bacterium]
MMDSIRFPDWPPAVAVFFYGSYMSRAVLANIGFTLRECDVASLSGFDIEIRPIANLVRAPGSSVCGILTLATHADLERIYSHARDVLGQIYLPHAVLVETSGTGYRPALCYIAPSMEPRPPDGAYLDRVLAAAREVGFPASYLARIESFRAPRAPG